MSPPGSLFGAPPGPSPAEPAREPKPEAPEAEAAGDVEDQVPAAPAPEEEPPAPEPPAAAPAATPVETDDAPGRRRCRRIPGARAPLPAADVFGPGRPGGDRPHPPERDPEEPDLACVPVRGTARRGQDHHRPHPREGAQLLGRRRPEPGALRGVSVLPRGRRRLLARRARDRRCQQQQRRKGARDHRDRALHPLARPLQDLPGGRGPHAEAGAPSTRSSRRSRNLRPTSSSSSRPPRSTGSRTPSSRGARSSSSGR